MGAWTTPVIPDAKEDGQWEVALGSTHCADMPKVYPILTADLHLTIHPYLYSQRIYQS